jgi:murein DD-endopeptidase MepM/ murein hydrolase activator NlpD
MTHAHSRSTHARVRRVAIGATAVAVLAFGATQAVSQVEVPNRTADRSGAAPAPTATTTPSSPTAALRASTPATVVIRLRLGSRGEAVKNLQRALRKRGFRVSIDGVYGPGTRAAVRALQRRLNMRPTGVADTKLLKRLKLKTRAVASVGVSSPARGTGMLSVFPLIGDYSYFDDFGAARHQGSHEGTDIMADKGTPLVAVADGVMKRVQRTETGLGGIYVWLQRADGTEYYYAHMASIATGIEPGTRVSAGQVIGTVGNTGDARYGAHHLHFEIRTGGTTPINPYTHLVAVDPTRQSSAALRR